LATASATCIVVAFPPRSGVLVPVSRTLLTALRTEEAPTEHASSCLVFESQSSIIATVRIIAIGFATPFPAMSGAAPWTGSKRAKSAPMFAEGVIPSPPTSWAASSESMSP